MTSATSTGSYVASTTVADSPVFIKRITLSKLELDHRPSTANIFKLPMTYHYGIASTGFGAWRELAANTLTTNWVLASDTPHFALLHHHRVLPLNSTPTPTPDSDIDDLASLWGHNLRVRERLLSPRTATHELVMFLEFIPRTLASYVES